MLIVCDENGPEVFPVDDDSVRISKGDCALYLRPVYKGFLLKDADIPGIEKAAPLIYNLGIPVDIVISKEDVAGDLALKILSALSKDCDRFILHSHHCAKQDNAYLYVALVEVFGAALLNITGKVGWRAFELCSHKVRDEIVGVNNLVYHNISKRIEAFGSSLQ